jgi:hypothetical protein
MIGTKREVDVNVTTSSSTRCRMKGMGMEAQIQEWGAAPAPTVRTTGTAPPVLPAAHQVRRSSLVLYRQFFLRALVVK